MGIVNQFFRFLFFFGADGIGPEFMDALGGKSKMAHNRNSGRQDTLDRFENFFSSFEFDGVGSRFFHDTDGWV